MLGAFAAKLRRVCHQNHFPRGVAHRFTDAEHLVERRNARIQVDAVGAHKEFIKAEVVEGILRQLAVKRRRFFAEGAAGIRMVCSQSFSDRALTMCRLLSSP